MHATSRSGAPAPSREDLSRMAQAFGMDTAAGRLLRGIYGKPGYSAAPSFRGLATRPLGGPQPRMRDLGAPLGRARDPTAATLDRSAPLEVPSVLPAPPAPPAPIDALGPQRRSASAIRARSEAEARAGDIALPPLRRGRNTELEKARLQAINQFKGGKGGGLVQLAATDGALPLALLQPPGHARGGAQLAQAQAQARPGTTDSALLQALKGTYAAVATGMEEAEAYMRELRALGGATAAAEARHASEVLAQGRELARLQALMNREASARRPVTVELGASRSPGGGSGGGGGGGGASGSPPRAAPRAIGEGDCVAGGFRVPAGSGGGGGSVLALLGGEMGVVGVSPTKARGGGE